MTNTREPAAASTAAHHHPFNFEDLDEFLKKLPMGYRFMPTREELLKSYLLPKINNDLSLDNRLIVDVNVYIYNPWNLAEIYKSAEDSHKGMKEYYFFSPKFCYCQHRIRPAGEGLWEVTGDDTLIYDTEDQKKLLGCRKSLVFFNRKRGRFEKTNWIMHEYHNQLDAELVVCRITEKTGRREQHQRMDTITGDRHTDTVNNRASS